MQSCCVVIAQIIVQKNAVAVFDRVISMVIESGWICLWSIAPTVTEMARAWKRHTTIIEARRFCHY